MKTFKYFISLPIILFLSIISLPSLFGQNLHGKALADSLINELAKTNNDTDKIKLIAKVSKALASADPSAAMKYADSAMHLSQNLKWEKGIALAYQDKSRIFATTSNFVTGLDCAVKAYQIFKAINWMPGMADALAGSANNYEGLGNYYKAIDDDYKALNMYEQVGNEASIAWMYNNIGSDYYWLNNYKKALDNYNKALVLQKKVDDKNGIASALDNIADVYEDEGRPDMVNEYNLQAIKLFEEINDQPALGRIYINRGIFMQQQKNFDSAIIFYNKAISIAQKLGIKRTIAFGNNGIGELYLNVAKNGFTKYIIPDSLKKNRSMLLQKAHDYFLKAMQLGQQTGELSLDMQFAKALSQTESLRGNYKAALNFYEQYTQYKDSVFNEENERKIATLENERLAEVKDKEIQLLNKEKALQTSEEQKKDAEAKRSKNIQYFIIMLLVIVVLAIAVIAILQYKSNKHRKKTNELLEKQKQKVETTLQELKSTQAQLIQSEKMASLGELTAGIAHEIQNPLNFVNNFSEVNNELIEELKNQKSNLKNEEQDEILNDIFLNNEKINHHGKRADAIVKGMLQHSRQTKGMKEPTDINALCDEYLRLSFHGLRAKDKSFNAVLTEVGIKTDFDESVGKINIVPQDIGRVLLNLFNNAFYAVNEKKKLSANGYQPITKVTTRKLDNKIEIRIEDNGNGIPPNIIDKIFQPFFTTKPTGQGTGLGLSLAYDIITKEHNGTIKVESKEGEGSEFVIQLPIQS